MEIVPIRAFRDNYIWAIHEGGRAVVVDPGEAAPVAAHLAEQRLELDAILVTHHHPDHVGGIAALASRDALCVYGPAAESIPGVTRPVAAPQTVRLPGIGIELAVLDVPGHTRGHVAYYGANLLFCGDTLFGCGCGRLFEGSAEQMWRSLGRLASLPGETYVFSAHEYTQANIGFALEVEPGNAALRRRDEEVRRRRAALLPTLPSSIAEECATNPFLRCAQPEVIRAASRFRGRPLADPAEVFAALRAWKDGF
ncbi:MAG: hydroxyacylglutathione hydrolase [Rhodocyclales bacterium CG17_big_fil_post_rev_8_21_14_2_50_68_7]|nr:MAG: hydroxyacylglutathione hydrolase [Betaproteobacteria bacterium CG2_30_68_42]PIV71764.1 MAG: hydroxyacylglutathione hydrolase [Rhodocyclales bacterium CG17_big_fil_post_rev_8_21_14_2_50_68_7]PJA56275.1 MAG: hydroxyacylglutathione hydrolase [Rhodocyclales bacterium CG_4_9_14_3_um_filter_68_10]